MYKSEYQNFIFDLDGTLIDSSDEILKCLKNAILQSGITFDESKITKNLIGPPIREIVKKLKPYISESKLMEITTLFRKEYDYSENDITTLYEGVIETLSYLRENDKKMFIATFKPSIPTFRVIEKFNLKKIFLDIYTVDKFQTPMTKTEMIRSIISTYSLDYLKTLMLGDGLNDMTAAKQNNITAVAALWGYEDNKQELIASADYSIKSFGEL